MWPFRYTASFLCWWVLLHGLAKKRHSSAASLVTFQGCRKLTSSSWVYLSPENVLCVMWIELAKIIHAWPLRLCMIVSVKEYISAPWKESIIFVKDQFSKLVPQKGRTFNTSVYGICVLMMVIGFSFLCAKMTSGKHRHRLGQCYCVVARHHKDTQLFLKGKWRSILSSQQS